MTMGEGIWPLAREEEWLSLGDALPRTSTLLAAVFGTNTHCSPMIPIPGRTSVVDTSVPPVIASSSINSPMLDPTTILESSGLHVELSSEEGCELLLGFVTKEPRFN